ncbi:hypothetical protein FHW58_001885 [Duganella sp. 1224]|uniref:hypothetical protein n=1 Tax=Duganella sp. 1224 TaxID=2587052 RepID=UPI0015CE20C0|nr:hypothetical protein [Duganella sp. 1224]NYE60733.1 hypothetical protein [Duganella sp. 1224]
MKRRSVVALVSAGLLSCVAYVLTRGALNTETPPATAAASLPAQLGPPDHNDARAPVPRSACPAGAAQSPFPVLRKVDGDSPQIDELLVASFTTPAAVRNKADHGDADAASAYFRMALSCAPFTEGESKPLSSGCQENVSRVDAFRLLYQAAEQGSVPAQTLFALNAPTHARFLRQQGSNESLAESVKLIKLAEHFGTLAAHGGSEEAVTFMISAYLNGTFGVRDTEKAYFYLLPLAAQQPSDAATTLIGSIKKTLNEKTRGEIERAALGCQSPASPIVNPFGAR